MRQGFKYGEEVVDLSNGQKGQSCPSEITLNIDFYYFEGQLAGGRRDRTNHSCVGYH